MALVFLFESLVVWERHCPLPHYKENPLKLLLYMDMHIF